LIRALHTGQERVLVQVASDKVLDVSISSMLYSVLCPKAYFCLFFGRTQGSRKLGFSGGYNVPMKANPFNFWGKVIDCGDIPVTS